MPSPFLSAVEPPAASRTLASVSGSVSRSGTQRGSTGVPAQKPVIPVNTGKHCRGAKLGGGEIGKREPDEDDGAY